jgi:hypothetical protein
MMGADGNPVLDANGKPAKVSVYPTRGPINTADVRFEIDGRQYTIEDCGIPSMFARIVRTGLDNREALLSLADPVAFVGGQISSNISSLFETIKERIFGRKPPNGSKDPHATEAELIETYSFSMPWVRTRLMVFFLRG